MKIAYIKLLKKQMFGEIILLLLLLFESVISGWLLHSRFSSFCIIAHTLIVPYCVQFVYFINKEKKKIWNTLLKYAVN